MLVVDTGVLVAAADDSDRDHAMCAELFETGVGTFVTSPLVIAEAGRQELWRVDDALVTVLGLR